MNEEVRISSEPFVFIIPGGWQSILGWHLHLTHTEYELRPPRFLVIGACFGFMIGKRVPVIRGKATDKEKPFRSVAPKKAEDDDQRTCQQHCIKLSQSGPNLIRNSASLIMDWEFGTTWPRLPRIGWQTDGITRKSGDERASAVKRPR